MISIKIDKHLMSYWLHFAILGALEKLKPFGRKGSR